MRRLNILLILYRQLWPITNTISLLMWVMAGRPAFSSIKFAAFVVAFIWLRSFCQLLIWYLFRSFNRKGFAFYHHFGLSEIQLASMICEATNRFDCFDTDRSMFASTRNFLRKNFLAALSFQGV